MAHIDHLEVDLQLCDSKTNQLLGKCWLTLMILSSPRRVAAFYETFDPPSYRSVMMVMRLCVKRYGRLPTAITVDGGPEFRSVYFEQLLALYRVRKHQRPAHEPRFGSPLERLFGTLDTSFILHLIRALALALTEHDQTITENHLGAAAPSEDRVKEMLSAALAGEADLTEPEGADERLLELLGLREKTTVVPVTPGNTQGQQVPEARSHKPGERSPGRDEIGESFEQDSSRE